MNSRGHTDPALAALAALRLDWTQGPEDVWRPSLFHVESLHRNAMRLLRGGLAEAAASTDGSPIGVVVQGQRGAGKTHLLGWLRAETQGEDGYFFLVSLLDAKGFWESVVVSLLDGLARETVDGWNQLRFFLWRLSAKVGAADDVRRAVTGVDPLTRQALDDFVARLRRLDPRIGRTAQNTARALALLASEDFAMQDIGHSYLQSMPEEEPGERAVWGMRREDKTPQEIVTDVSALLSLTGPTVVAVDQIDSLIAQSSFASDHDPEGEWRTALLIEQVAGGLMALREVTRRTLTVVSCIPATWVHIERVATDTVRDRFRTAVQLKTIPDAETGRELIARRFAARFRSVGFTPPHPTWPVSLSAFEDAPDLTPRQLLRKVDDHVRSCLESGQITELDRLVTAHERSAAVSERGGYVPEGERGAAGPERAGDQSARPWEPQVTEAGLAALDDRFAELRNTARVEAALDPATEDAVMPALLAAGLTAWVAGLGEEGNAFTVDPPPSAKPPLHARLRRVLDEDTEDEAHWSFRAIASPNPIAALTRLRAAAVAAGLETRSPKRRLFLLRNHPWSAGARTREAIAEIENAGGRVLPVEVEDLRTLAALRDLLAENPPELRAWLAARRPAEQVGLLKEALHGVWTVPSVAPAPHAGSRPEPGAASGDVLGARPLESPKVPAVSAEPATGTPVAQSVTVGVSVTDGAPLRLSLAGLRKHVAIFAGSGSGKTVLIRGLVERCALAGVSAIVLDPNNDLARLGDRWPQPPLGRSAEEAALAEEYLAATDVVIWTPGRVGGRPLAFQPLPDFAAVVDDPDQYAEAVESAVAAIVPRINLEGRTQKAQLSRAVLREALQYYGRRGTASLQGFIELLADLPDGVSEIGDARRLAEGLAQALTAAKVNDPMFAGEGEAVDPGVLLTPPPGKRARVSVISFVGLQSDTRRQSFVNQLQMALFSWIKKNPAVGRPLGGLFIMDEAQAFAPSGALTPCTQSTLALAAQARKYGLGLVFATQAPKGLHNRIPGNAATQFFGLLNSPAQIEAAREMARYKGGEVSEIARLRPGEFYAAVEGGAFVRMQTPMCLTHHPADPLTTEEVLDRACRTG